MRSGASRDAFPSGAWERQEHPRSAFVRASGNGKSPPRATRLRLARPRNFPGIAAARRVCAKIRLMSFAAAAEKSATPRFARAMIHCAPALLTLLFLAHLLGEYGARKALLGVSGILVGMAFYRSRFTFAGAWRGLVARGDPRGLRAQMLMVAVAVPPCAALIAAGEFFSYELVGAVRPVTAGVFVGAALFGIGTQMGGACVSGSLLLFGGGSWLAFVGLAMFVAGATTAAAQISFWSALPGWEPFSFSREWGVWSGVLFSLALAGMVSFVLPKLFAGRRDLASENSPDAPWSMARGAAALGVLLVFVLILGGQPLGVVNGMTVLGGKILAATGLADLEFWDYWATFPGGGEMLSAGIFAGAQNVTNAGIVLGAGVAALLAGGWNPRFGARPPLHILAAALGGFLMGYGAQISFGCNMGGFISATVSGSLHGWLWLASALAGTAVGVPVRKLFKLPA